MQYGKWIVTGALIGLLAACGGGGGGGDSGSTGEQAESPSPEAPGSVSPAVTMANLSSANIDSTGFPWNAGVGAGVTKRWNLPIPVQTGGDARADAAMTEIEKRLGQTVFDRKSIQSADPATVTSGLIVSQGTAYVPAGEKNLSAYCANVASAPSQGGYPASFYDGSTGVIDTKLYINLDNSGCTASADIVIHEFGHALGFGAHFEGFGNGDSINEAFWVALKTLYGNPAGTAKADVKVVE